MPRDPGSWLCWGRRFLTAELTLPGDAFLGGLQTPMRPQWFCVCEFGWVNAPGVCVYGICVETTGQPHMSVLSLLLPLF